MKSATSSMALTIALALPLAAGSCGSLGPAQLDRDQPISGRADETAERGSERGVVGMVTAVNGNPVVGAMIGAKSLDHPGPAIPERIVLSRADGHYWWPLPPGNYEMTATAAGYRAATAQVHVEAQGPANADFRLEQIE